MPTDSERNKAFRKERTVRARARTRIQKDTYAEILRLLKQAEDQVTAVLAGAPSDYQLWQLPHLQAEIQRAMRDLGEQSAARISTGAGDAWQAGLDLIDRPIEAGGVRISGRLPVIDTRQLVAMRTFMVDRARDIGTALANKINSELGVTAIGGQSVGDAVTNVTRLLKTGGRSRALTIVRTELGRAFAVAANERMDQAAEILPGLKKQWRRSGKVHSRLTHDTIDGQIREPSEKFRLGSGIELKHPRDPAAPAAETINCGCESLPFMKSWEVEHPGAKPFSEQEIALDPRKAEMAQAAAQAVT